MKYEIFSNEEFISLNLKKRSRRKQRKILQRVKFKTRLELSPSFSPKARLPMTSSRLVDPFTTGNVRSEESIFP